MFTAEKLEILYTGGESQQQIKNITEWMCLYARLLDLYRHSGLKSRLDTAVKHGRFCGDLIIKNKHRMMSIAAYDRAQRKGKAKSLDWSYDEAIGVATLERYVKDEGRERSTGGRSTNRNGGSEETRHGQHWQELIHLLWVGRWWVHAHTG